MRKIASFVALASALGLSACGDTMGEQALIGGGVGAGTAVVLDKDPLAGAAVRTTRAPAEALSGRSVRPSEIPDNAGSACRGAGVYSFAKGAETPDEGDRCSRRS